MALVRRFDPRRAFRPTVDHSQTIRRIAFRGLLVRISHSAFFVFMVVSVIRSAAGQTLATRFPATTQCSSGGPPCTISVSSRLLSPDEEVRVTWSTAYQGIVDVYSFSGHNP